MVPKERVCGPVKTGAESKMGTGGILAMGKVRVCCQRLGYM